MDTALRVLDHWQVSDNGRRLLDTALRVLDHCRVWDNGLRLLDTALNEVISTARLLPKAMVKYGVFCKTNFHIQT